MADLIPEGLSREDVEQAVSDFEAGTTHEFANSTRYDLIFAGRRFPPKAILGLAARRLAGRTLKPSDFSGGEGSRCFRILRKLGFDIYPKPENVDSDISFVVGSQYTRNDIYTIANVPEEKRHGDWNTGYTRWENELYIFAAVGSAGTGGYDYDNGWEENVFRWYAKQNTKLSDPEIQWMLGDARRVYIFTRPAVRNPFTFEGLGTPVSHMAQTPVLIRWQVSRDLGEIFAVMPTEQPKQAKYVEGATRTVVVNSYERNQNARDACIDHYGIDCAVCDFNFAGYYGEIGEGFIHVHHLKDLATIGGEYEVDAIQDLRPVCPNCHAMLHTESPAMNIEKLRAILKRT